ncbi:peptidoglycan-binding protein [Cronobacter muytjensii]
MSSLRFGDRGTEVKAHQKMLNAEGYNLGADGIFGRKTEYAVRLFQAKKTFMLMALPVDVPWRL